MTLRLNKEYRFGYKEALQDVEKIIEKYKKHNVEEVMLISWLKAQISQLKNNSSQMISGENPNLCTANSRKGYQDNRTDLCHYCLKSTKRQEKT